MYTYLLSYPKILTLWASCLERVSSQKIIILKFLGLGLNPPCCFYFSRSCNKTETQFYFQLLLTWKCKNCKKMKLFYFVVFLFFLLSHAAILATAEKERITLYPDNNNITELTKATFAESVFNSNQASEFTEFLFSFVIYRWIGMRLMYKVYNDLSTAAVLITHGSPAKWPSTDVTMHAIHFWGQERGLPVGRECPYLWLKKRECKREKISLD